MDRALTISDDSTDNLFSSSEKGTDLIYTKHLASYDRLNVNTCTRPVSSIDLSSDTTFSRCNELRCSLINARSLKNKILDLHVYLQCNDLDIVAVTETWLNETVTNSALTGGSKYHVIRKDRHNGLGGGVAALISDNVDFAEEIGRAHV